MLILKLKFPPAGAFDFPLVTIGETEGTQMVFRYWIKDRTDPLLYIFNIFKTLFLNDDQIIKIKRNRQSKDIEENILGVYESSILVTERRLIQVLHF